MTLTIPTVQQVVTEVKDNPRALRQLLDTNLDLLNIVMQVDTKNAVKYIRISEKDQKNLIELKKKGVTEGAVIGLALALFFELMNGT